MPLRVASADNSGNILDFVDVTVRYNLTEGIRLRSDISEFTVKMVPGQASITQTVTLTGDGISWERQLGGYASEFRVTTNPASGTIPVGGSQAVDITVAAQDSGISSTTFVPVDFVNIEGYPNGTSVQVRMNSIDGLKADPTKIDVIVPANSVDVKTIEFTMDAYSSGRVTPVNWSAEVDQPWLTIDNLSGSFSPIDTTTHPVINVSVDPTGLEIGSYSGNVSVTHDLSEQNLLVPVTLTIQGEQVRVAQKGFGLSNLTTTSGTVGVFNDRGEPIGWEATTNASWLTISESGIAGQELTFSADPNQVSSDGYSEATIFITSTDSSILNTEEVMVGFWKGTEFQDAVKITIPAGDELSARKDFAADPIRPYIYARTNTDRAGQALLKTFNIYTGELVGTPIELADYGWANLVVSDDGQSLYVVAANTTSGDFRTQKINLSDMTITDFPLSGIRDVIFGRVNGQALLISNQGDFYDGETLEKVGEIDGYLNTMTISQNGHILCNNNDQTFRSDYYCYKMLGTGVTGGPITAEPIENFLTGEEDELTPAFDLSPDGTVLYYIRDKDLDPGTEITLNGVLTSDMVTPAFPPINNIPYAALTVDGLGNILVGSGFQGRGLQLSAYNPNGALIGESTTAGFAQSTTNYLLSSGDVSRAIFTTVGHTGGTRGEIQIAPSPSFQGN